tara:strand:- start:44 stop:271 length:228 start_codon:yes stop_codon:yes gene_type:complete
MNLKEYIIDYVGKDHDPKDDEVTVEMIAETLASEFPELMLMMAEENYLRGYEQALDDVNEIRKKYGEQATIRPKI